MKKIASTLMGVVLLLASAVYGAANSCCKGSGCCTGQACCRLNNK